jgi:hypothetical protein
MKLCKDCKYFEITTFQLVSCTETEYYCTRFKKTYIEPVLGEIKTAYGGSGSTCRMQRSTIPNDACGPDGQYWEAK